jgi:hypothetical protein
VLIQCDVVNKIEKLPPKKTRNQKWFCFSQEPRVKHLNDSLFLSYFDESLISYGKKILYFRHLITHLELDSFAPHPAYFPKFKEYYPITKKDAPSPVAAFISNCGSQVYYVLSICV